MNINKNIDSGSDEKKHISNCRIIEMDMAKAIGAILVIVIHVSAFCLVNSSKNDISYNISLVLNQISRSSVPLFVLFSGIGLSLSYNPENTYIKYITHRIFKILPGYILFGIIYLIVVKKDLNYLAYFEKFLKGDEVYYHLYFVPMIIKLYLLFPILYPLMKRKIGLVVSFLITFIITISSHYFNKPDLNLEFFHKNNTLFWLFYFALGVYIAPKIKFYINWCKRYKRELLIIFLLCSVMIVGEAMLNIRNNKSLDYSTTFIRTSVIVYSLVTLVFLFSLDYKMSKLRRSLKIINSNSYNIYLCHPLIIFYYMKLFKKINLNVGSIYFFISALIISILISVMLSCLINCMKILKKKVFYK